MPAKSARLIPRWPLLAICLLTVLAVSGAQSYLAFGQGASTGILGQHTVQSKETLYCIGRAYGVLPSAIAQTNGLDVGIVLSPGLVLNIPAVQWASVPPGPVCAAQFVSPFPSLPTPTSTIPVIALPTRTLVPEVEILGKHTVQKGETLYCVGRAYAVSPLAIARANRIVWPYRLTPNQVLAIPAVRWTPIPRGPVCKAQFSSPYITSPTSTATPNSINPPSEPTITPTSRISTKTPIPTRTAAPKP